MIGISPQDLLNHVVGPILSSIGLGGVDAEALMMGTAAQESGCGRFLAQLHGPALGVWQMEPATHDDLWKNYLAYREPLHDSVMRLRLSVLPGVDQLAGNLYYACAMARLDYARCSEKLPAAGDLDAQAAYYKLHYNTPGGAGTAAEYIANAKAAGLPGLFV